MSERPPPQFIHLRCHSEFSIQDGMIRVSDYVQHAVNDAMPALALTDLGNLFAAIKFYQAARKAGIKPILGCDVYLESAREQSTRMLLLCQSKAGYTLLCKLLSRAYTQNQHRKRALFKRKWFEEQGSDGLLLLSGGLQGEIGQTLLQGDRELAERLTQYWADLFPQRFYFEVSRAEQPGEEAYIQAARALAAQFALPLVATHPVQFLTMDDFDAHEARVCIAQGYTLSDQRREKQFTPRQYCISQEEMVARFADIPEALENTIHIAQRCTLELTLGEAVLPDFPIPANTDLGSYLDSQAEQGLMRRLETCFSEVRVRTEKLPLYQERLQFELTVIKQMAFAGYFLIVADFIRWAKQNGVPVGPGRGSGAGSLVAYSLGITELDPIAYGLLFERFLNPERKSMPDFDIDFCQDGRDRVIEYVKQKYGHAAVAQIITFGTMAAKGVVRDVGRVLDLPYKQVDELAKLIPTKLDNKRLPADKGYQEVNLEVALLQEPQLKKRVEDSEEFHHLFRLASKLEGITRNVGTHAGGVLISRGEISDFSPLYCQEDGSGVTSQYDKDDVEAVGLVKFDFLGLRTLTILHSAIAHANIERVSEKLEALSLSNIPLNDVATFDCFKRGNVSAVFQFESDGMKEMLLQAQPDCLEDLIALNAMYRPGPMEYLPEFCRRKHNRQRIEYPHPLTKDILQETYGIAAYQEQVMQIAQVVAGYSLGQADLLRRAMSKKKPEEMEAQRAIFVDGSQTTNTSKEQAEKLFHALESFAGYGFNKSHAAAYALVAYQTAYLKTHYPAAFMAATMSAEMRDTDKLRFFYDDCRYNGITVLPPDINLSMANFMPIAHQVIRYGLAAIKGAGEVAINAIVTERQAHGNFKSLNDFCTRMDLQRINRRVIEALIRSGSFDSLEANRAALLAGVEDALGMAQRQQNTNGQSGLFGDHSALNIHLPVVPAWTMQEQLHQERIALGFYLSGHPFADYAILLAPFTKTRLDRLNTTEQTQLFAGMIENVRESQNARGRLAFITLDDGHGRLDILITSELLQNNAQELKQGSLLIAEVRLRMRGREVEHGDDRPAVLSAIAQQLYELDSFIQQHAQKLYLLCHTPTDAKQLKKILMPHCQTSSRCEIFVDYRTATASISLKLGQKWRITPSTALIRELKDWLGLDKVKLL